MPVSGEMAGDWGEGEGERDGNRGNICTWVSLAS